MNKNSNNCEADASPHLSALVIVIVFVVSMVLIWKAIGAIVSYYGTPHSITNTELVVKKIEVCTKSHCSYLVTNKTTGQDEFVRTWRTYGVGQVFYRSIYKDNWTTDRFMLEYRDYPKQ